MRNEVKKKEQKNQQQHIIVAMDKLTVIENMCFRLAGQKCFSPYSN